jgi:hypothetical protein
VSTPRPKSLAILFLTGAFLTGGAVGYAADRAMAKPEPQRPDERSMREELARELRLTPEQQIKVDSAIAWRRARSRTIMKVVQPSLDAVRDSARTMMMNTLDSTQQAALRRLIERNQRTADSVARARGEPK